MQEENDEGERKWKVGDRRNVKVYWEGFEVIEDCEKAK